jgi:hypothetical protein
MYLLRIYIISLALVFNSFGMFAQFQVENVLNTINEQYVITQKNKSVGSLVRLDSMIRSFVDSARNSLSIGEQVKHWKDEYSKLGLRIGHYSGYFEYSEQFLFEAHSLDSNSSYRSYTLYAPIVGIDHSDRLGWFPHIDVAFQYVKEFPGGHFIFDVYVILADYYKDLYMALRDGKEGASYHYDCLEEYIDKTPIRKQLLRAQKSSIYYYEQALKIRPNHSGVKEILGEVKNGTVTSWSTCSD